MIATVPTYKPQRSVILVKCSVALLFLLSAIFAVNQLESFRRASVASEYENSRGSILSNIANAVERQDVKTLREINDRYSRYVSDGTFRSAISQALAKVAAHEAALELTIAKHLDVLRNQEEAPNWTLPRTSESPEEERVTLSKLPR